MNRELMNTCNECGSAYRPEASEMAALCPECTHRLYGYKNCPHEMESGRCKICGWDGSVSPFLKYQNQGQEL
ncbi:hypothetical protein BZG80_09390 [Salinivibrio sp. MA440]|nr:hypothetical protein BZG80_09390 [Salinivibrio sp. MA440]